MQYAFRAVCLCFVCLLLMPEFHLPAYATEGDVAKASPGQVTEHAPKTGVKNPPAALSQPEPKHGPEPAQASGPEQLSVTAQARNGWVKVESGSRQAYVGIHGGTAPLTLMRSADGVLFAFTGQTGNDFTQVLKGGNASRSAANAPSHPDQNGAENAAGPLERTTPAEGQALNSDGQAALPASTQAPEAEKADTQLSASSPADPASGSAAPSVAAASAPAVPSPSPVTQPAPAPVQTSALSSAPAGQPAGTAAPSAAPVADEQGKSTDAASAPAPASGGKEQAPANSADLVFASGGLASNIKGSPEDYLPFGLTPQAAVVEQEQESQISREELAPLPVPVRLAPAPKPLKLRSYQQVLSYPGSV